MRGWKEEYCKVEGERRKDEGERKNVRSGYTAVYAMHALPKFKCTHTLVADMDTHHTYLHDRPKNIYQVVVAMRHYALGNEDDGANGHENWMKCEQSQGA